MARFQDEHISSLAATLGLQASPEVLDRLARGEKVDLKTAVDSARGTPCEGLCFGHKPRFCIKFDPPSIFICDE